MSFIPRWCGTPERRWESIDTLCRIACLRLGPSSLGILFLVTISAFCRRCLAVTVFGPVAGNAQARAGGGIVKCRREAGRYRRRGRFGMAIGAGLLRRHERLLGLRGVMADLAFPRHLEMCRVGKLYSSHRGALQQYRALGRILRGHAANRNQE